MVVMVGVVVAMVCGGDVVVMVGGGDVVAVVVVVMVGLQIAQ